MRFQPLPQAGADLGKVGRAVEVDLGAVQGAGDTVDVAVAEAGEDQVPLQVDGLLRLQQVGAVPGLIARVPDDAVFDLVRVERLAIAAVFDD